MFLIVKGACEKKKTLSLPGFSLMLLLSFLFAGTLDGSERSEKVSEQTTCVLQSKDLQKQFRAYETNENLGS